mgnify:FL=1|tara:strand:- start:172464 stop:172670 length:207 start_codon:yes stop_codon:yes gene_type:complete
MTPKLKSLLFLLCFILCSLFYYHDDENEKKESSVKSSNFVSAEMIDMDDSENLNSELDAIKKEEMIEE